MNNILIIRFSALGDLVTLEPTFRALRTFLPKAKITFLTSNIGKGLYEDSDYFDKIVIHKGLFSSLEKLRKNRYKYIINLQCTRPSHWISLFLKKEQLINSSASMLEKYFYIKPKVKRLPELLLCCGVEKNIIDEYIREPKNTIISLPSIQNNELNKKLKSFAKDRKIIAIATGTSPRWSSKKWGDDRYLKLANHFSDLGYSVVLIGSKDELDISKKIESQNSEVLNLVNKTSLSELKSILKDVDIFIGNDSGPAHIAAGVGTKTITIFGSTSTKHSPSNMPYANSHVSLCATPLLACQPCYKTTCPTKHECMEEIKVDDVVNITEKILDENNE